MMISSQTSSKADSGRSKHATLAPAAATQGDAAPDTAGGAGDQGGLLVEAEVRHGHCCSFRLAVNRWLRGCWAKEAVSLEIIPQQRRVEYKDDEHPIAEPRRPVRVNDGRFDHRVARGSLPPPEPREAPTAARATRASPMPLRRDTGRCSWTCGCRLPPPHPLVVDPRRRLVVWRPALPSRDAAAEPALRGVDQRGACGCHH